MCLCNNPRGVYHFLWKGWVCMWIQFSTHLSGMCGSSQRRGRAVGKAPWQVVWLIKMMTTMLFVMVTTTPPHGKSKNGCFLSLVFETVWMYPSFFANKENGFWFTCSSFPIDWFKKGMDGCFVNQLNMSLIYLDHGRTGKEPCMPEANWYGTRHTARINYARNQGYFARDVCILRVILLPVQ